MGPKTTTAACPTTREEGRRRPRRRRRGRGKTRRLFSTKTSSSSSSRSAQSSSSSHPTSSSYLYISRDFAPPPPKACAFRPPSRRKKSSLLLLLSRPREKESFGVFCSPPTLYICVRVSEDIYRERIGFLYLNRPSLFSFVCRHKALVARSGKTTNDDDDDGFEDSYDDVRFPGRFRVRLVLRASVCHSNTTRTTSVFFPELDAKRC